MDGSYGGRSYYGAEDSIPLSPAFQRRFSSSPLKQAPQAPQQFASYTPRYSAASGNERIQSVSAAYDPSKVDRLEAQYGGRNNLSDSSARYVTAYERLEKDRVGGPGSPVAAAVEARVYGDDQYRGQAVNLTLESYRASSPIKRDTYLTATPSSAPPAPSSSQPYSSSGYTSPSSVFSAAYRARSPSPGRFRGSANAAPSPAYNSFSAPSQQPQSSNNFYSSSVSAPSYSAPYSSGSTSPSRRSPSPTRTRQFSSFSNSSDTPIYGASPVPVSSAYRDSFNSSSSLGSTPSSSFSSSAVAGERVSNGALELSRWKDDEISRLRTKCEQERANTRESETRANDLRKQLESLQMEAERSQRELMWKDREMSSRDARILQMTTEYNALKRQMTEQASKYESLLQNALVNGPSSSPNADIMGSPTRLSSSGSFHDASVVKTLEQQGNLIQRLSDQLKAKEHELSALREREQQQKEFAVSTSSLSVDASMEEKTKEAVAVAEFWRKEHDKVLAEFQSIRAQLSAALYEMDCMHQFMEQSIPHLRSAGLLRAEGLNESVQRALIIHQKWREQISAQQQAARQSSKVINVSDDDEADLPLASPRPSSSSSAPTRFVPPPSASKPVEEQSSPAQSSPVSADPVPLSASVAATPAAVNRLSMDPAGPVRGPSKSEGPERLASVSTPSSVADSVATKQQAQQSSLSDASAGMSAEARAPSKGPLPLPVPPKRPEVVNEQPAVVAVSETPANVAASVAPAPVVVAPVSPAPVVAPAPALVSAAVSAPSAPVVSQEAVVTPSPTTPVQASSTPVKNRSIPSSPKVSAPPSPSHSSSSSAPVAPVQSSPVPSAVSTPVSVPVSAPAPAPVEQAAVPVVAAPQQPIVSVPVTPTVVSSQPAAAAISDPVQQTPSPAASVAAAPIAPVLSTPAPVAQPQQQQASSPAAVPVSAPAVPSMSSFSFDNPTFTAPVSAPVAPAPVAAVTVPAPVVAPVSAPVEQLPSQLPLQQMQAPGVQQQQQQSAPAVVPPVQATPAQPEVSQPQVAAAPAPAQPSQVAPVVSQPAPVVSQPAPVVSQPAPIVSQQSPAPTAANVAAALAVSPPSSPVQQPAPAAAASSSQPPQVSGSQPGSKNVSIAPSPAASTPSTPRGSVSLSSAPVLQPSAAYASATPTAQKAPAAPAQVAEVQQPEQQQPQVSRPTLPVLSDRYNAYGDQLTEFEVKCVDYIKRGQYLLKYNVGNAKSQQRWVFLSPDETSVIWAEKPKTKGSSVELKTVSSLALGPVTPVLTRKTVRIANRHLCLSLVTGDRTLDLECFSDEQMFNIYIGLYSLLRRGGMRPMSKGLMLWKRARLRVDERAREQGMSRMDMLMRAITKSAAEADIAASGGAPSSQ